MSRLLSTAIASCSQLVTSRITLSTMWSNAWATDKFSNAQMAFSFIAVYYSKLIKPTSHFSTLLIISFLGNRIPCVAWNSCMRGWALANHSPITWYKLQHETILADLNRCMAKTHLVIILTDDAIKYMCIWLLLWCNKYKPHNTLSSLQQSLTFSLTQLKRKGSNEG